MPVQRLQFRHSRRRPRRLGANCRSGSGPPRVTRVRARRLEGALLSTGRLVAGPLRGGPSGVGRFGAGRRVPGRRRAGRLGLPSGGRLAVARVAAASLAGLLLAPGSAFAFPVAVTDDRCRTIEIQRQPRRMVALLPLYAEVLLDLDPAAAGRIVGIADAPGTPPELAAARSVGPSFAASRELIVALEPDVVLGATDYNGLRAHLEDAGITVFTAGCFAGAPDFGAIHGAEDIFAVIDALDRLSSAPDAHRGPELMARIRRGLDRVEQLVAGRSRPTVAVLYADLSGTAPPTVAGSGTPEYDALASAGGEPGFLHQGYAQVSFEELVRVDPTYLIADPAHVPHLLNDPRLARLTAVRERRVCAIPAARWTSSRVAKTVRAVAELLHPAAFGRVAAACAP